MPIIEETEVLEGYIGMSMFMLPIIAHSSVGARPYSRQREKRIEMLPVRSMLHLDASRPSTFLIHEFIEREWYEVTLKYNNARPLHNMPRYSVAHVNTNTIILLKAIDSSRFSAREEKVACSLTKSTMKSQPPLHYMLFIPIIVRGMNRGEEKLFCQHRGFFFFFFLSANRDDRCLLNKI